MLGWFSCKEEIGEEEQREEKLGHNEIVVNSWERKISHHVFFKVSFTTFGVQL